MAEELNFCEAFIQKIEGVQGIENKARYLLEDFFYKEGWSSKTNSNAMKEGYHQQYTYPKSSIAHFIEDFVRLFKKEYKEECDKIIESLNKKKKGEESKQKIILAIYEKEPHIRDNICHYLDPKTGSRFDQAPDGYKIVYDEPRKEAQD